MMTMDIVMACADDGRRTVLILMMLMLVVMIKLRMLIFVNTRSGVSAHKLVVFPTPLHNTDDIASQRCSKLLMNATTTVTTDDTVNAT